jgi:hypothetical protein
MLDQISEMRHPTNQRSRISAANEVDFMDNRRYSAGVSTVVEISAAIDKLDVKEQVELLRILPQHLKISLDEFARMRLAEPAFEFWNNPEDAIYDHL